MVKKILFVIPYLSDGGTERALSNITTHFPEEWEIDILVNSDKRIDYPFKGNIITLEVDEEPKTGSVWFQFKVFIKRVIKLRYLKRIGNYQACVSFLDSANIANVLSGKRKCKVILSVRNSLKQSAKLPQYKYIVNPLVRILYNYSDGVVAVSEGVRRELLSYFRLKKDKVTAIENGYDLKAIRQQAEQKENDGIVDLFPGHKVIITAGRLTGQKGQWHLIRAFTEIIKQVPSALLVIVGAGELETYLKELAKECNLGNKVIFTGFVSNPYWYEKSSDVFVLPSLFEGFPNALAEAVCLGIPCVATDFRTGAREILAPDMDVDGCEIESIVEAKYGILTPLCSGKRSTSLKEPLEYSERCFAKAITELLMNEGKRRRYAERSRCRSESLTIESVILKWIELIDR